MFQAGGEDNAGLGIVSGTLSITQAHLLQL